jgi:hypothetical protein
MSEHTCIAQLFPEHLIGKKDYEVLPELMGATSPLVTLDRTIVHEHASFIPSANAGIIVLKQTFATAPFNLKIAQSILSNFKQKFPEWARIDWCGAYVEISDLLVLAGKLTPNGPSSCKEFRLSNPNLRRQLKQHLSNIRRHLTSK